MSFINKIRKNIDIQMASCFKLVCCSSLAGTVVPVFGYSLSCKSSNRPCYSFANIQTVVPIVREGIVVVAIGLVLVGYGES